MVKRFRFITYILLAAISVALGQEEEPVEFEFKVFGVGRDSYENLFYFSGKEYLPLKFHRTHRSVKSYNYRGPNKLSIFVKNPDFKISEGPLPRFLPVAQVQVGIDTKHSLIVFSAAQNNMKVSDPERTFNLFALNDDKNYFPRSTIVILNTTGAKLFGKVANKKINLPIGASNPIPYKETSRGKSETKIALALETDEGVRLVMSNDVRLSTNRRVLLILEPPRRAGSFKIAVRKLSESIFPAKEDSPKG